MARAAETEAERALLGFGSETKIRLMVEEVLEGFLRKYEPILS